jgi:hypothetical protein
VRERAQNIEEQVALVDQVRLKPEEPGAASAFDIDAIDNNPDFVNHPLREVHELCASMADGSCLFGREDLPFMRLVGKCDEKTLPSIRLFYQINAAHRLGLDDEGD